MTNGKQNAHVTNALLSILEKYSPMQLRELASDLLSIAQWQATLESGETGTKPIDNGGWDSLTEDGNPYEPQPKVDKEAKR
jgi:hypothetical protein